MCLIEAYSFYFIFNIFPYDKYFNKLQGLNATHSQKLKLYEESYLWFCAVWMAL
jgi:hypothetical protein